MLGGLAFCLGEGVRSVGAATGCAIKNLALMGSCARPIAFFFTCAGMPKLGLHLLGVRV